MKQLLALAVLIVLAALTLVACAPASTPVPPAKPTDAPKATASPPAAVVTVAQTKPGTNAPYKIGVSATLSGALAGPATDFRDGIVVEVERINAAGGINGHPIELVIEDDGADPTRAATTLTKLIRQDQVLAILGPWGSFLEATTRPVAEREQIPLIIGSPTFAEIRAQKLKWSFNLSPNEIIGAGAMLEIVKDQGYKKVVVIAESTQLMQTMQETFATDATAAGIQVVVLSDTMALKDVDVTPQVTKLKDLIAKEKPQAIVAIISGTVAPFLKAVRQLGIDLPIVTDHALGSPLIIQLAGEDANGLRMPGSKSVVPDQLPDSDPQKAVILDFIKRFQAKYNKPPTSGLVGADAVNIVGNALKVSGADRTKLRDAIENTKAYVGNNGVFTYAPGDHEGLTKQAMAIYEVKDKKFLLVRTIK